jgi:hypothetical protein
MIHPNDKNARNPRIQCDICKKWMRMAGRDEQGHYFQRFYGGCAFTAGDHAAGSDVCNECCKIECKKLITN